MGAVLAGGRSSRFGSDKALAVANGKALLDHAIETLRQVTPQVVVCGRAWPGAVTVVDRPAPDMGPLAGLNSALHHARLHGFDWVLSLACDTPFVAPTLLSDIAARQRATFFEQHPVIGLWPAHAGKALDRLLASKGRHSLRAFAQAIGAVPLAGGEAIPNFNFAQDLDQWLAISQGPGVEPLSPSKSERIAFVDALATIRAAIAPGPWETVPTAIANGRILAQTAVARRDSPPFAMAAMDGYAIAEAMIAAPGERRLAIGRAQLRKLPDWLAARRANAEFLSQAVAEHPLLMVPEIPADITHAWYKYYLLLRPDMADPEARRAEMIAQLMEKGIPCGTGSCPDMSLELGLEGLGCRRDGTLANAHALGRHTLMLLVDHTLDRDDMARIAEALWELAA